MKREPREVLDLFPSKEVAIAYLSFELLENGKYCKDVAQDLSIPKQEIGRFCRENEIDPVERTARWYARRWGIPELETPHWLIQQKIEDENIEMGDLAKALEISTYVFGQQLERLGFDRKDFKRKKKFITVRCTNCEKFTKKELARIKNSEYFFCNNHCFGQWGGRKFGFGKGKKPWQDKEDQFIQENWSKMTDQEIALQLERKVSRVKERRRRLGIQRKPGPKPNQRP